MSRKCRTCGMPLWMAYFIMGLPFQKRDKQYKDATDCIHLLPKNVVEDIRKEVFDELLEDKK